MNQPVYQHRARKRFGQNFLHDQNIVERIVKAANPGGEKCLVEIGPGQGALTEQLLAQNGRLEVIEVDRDLATLLRGRYEGHPGFCLHERDVLKFDFNEIICDGPLHIVGNLPYNISTPLLFHLLNYHSRIESMLFMLQQEVVERLAADVGEKSYGRLGLMVQYYCEVEPLFRVPASAFSPQPKVESAIVRLTPHAVLPCPTRNPATLAKVVRIAFGQRRKTIRNSLRSLLSAEQLEALDIDTNLRPENLSLQEYVRISDTLED